MLFRTFPKREETERFSVDVRVSSEDIQHDTRRRLIISCTNNHTIANDEQKLALVVVLGLRKRVDRLPKRSGAFRITRDLTNNELVVILRRTSRPKVDGRDELEPNNADHKNGESEKDIGGEETLRRVTSVDFPNQEQVPQADPLSVQDIGIYIQSIELLRHILARIELEHIQNRLMHEVCINPRGWYRVLWLSNRRSVLNVRCEIIHHSPVNTDSLLLVCHILQLLRRISDKTDAIVPTHQDHALKVPIRARVCGERSEVVILCVIIGDVAGIEDNIWVDSAGDTVTQSADLL